MARSFFVIILLGAVALAALGLFLPVKEFLIIGSEAGLAPSLLRNKQPKEPAVMLYLVGDIILGRGVQYMINKQGAGDFRFPFLQIAPQLKEADILFGNLEGPISDKGAKVGSIYSFEFRPEAAEALAYAGFDVLSLANNHMLDYQRVALEDTMTVLKQNGIDYVGAGFDRTEAFSAKIGQVKDVKIGFLAYTNLGPAAWRAGADYGGMAWIDQSDFETIEADIKNIKQAVDVLVVSLHSGAEYSERPDQFQMSFAKACIEAGADLVAGHHPHVIQPLEQHQDGWIAYSLGNFVFDQAFSQEAMQGLLLKVVIKNGKIDQVFPQTVQLNEYFQPEFSEEGL